MYCGVGVLGILGCPCPEPLDPEPLLADDAVFLLLELIFITILWYSCFVDFIRFILFF